MTRLFFLIISILSFSVSLVLAATDIDPGSRYAWNQAITWIDFFQSNNVNFFSDRAEGWATSDVGEIALNCATTPNGNICGGAGGNWRVANDAAGNLSGWAWNDVIGWVSFDKQDCDADAHFFTDSGICGGDNATTPIFNYGVKIDGAGDFQGFAWNNTIGWISFNSANCDIDLNGYWDSGLCGGDNATASYKSYLYKVRTTSNTSPDTGNLTSSVYDTGGPSAFYS